MTSVMNMEAKTSSFNSAQKHKLASQLQRRMAGASIVSFSSETGLSVSWISKALNIQLDSRPSRRTLHKIVDPEVGEVNGVSLEELYENCGYHLPNKTDGVPAEEAAEDTQTKEPAGQYSLRKALASYYVGSYIEALRVFLNAWDKHGNAPDISISRRADNELFTITDTDRGFNAICIPGFCQDETGASVVKNELLSRMLKAIGVADQSSCGIKDTYFYILVDSQDVYEFCCDNDKLPRIPSMNLIILLSDEDHSGFTDGFARLSEERKDNKLPVLLDDDSTE